MIVLLRFVATLVLVGGIADLTIPSIKWLLTDKWDKKDMEKPKMPAKRATAIFLVGIFMLVALTGATQVPATHIAVVENTFTGQFFSLGPGTHICPFEPRLVPLMTSVAKYDLRRQTIEIGGQPVREVGVQADSNSPGRPVVYFYGRGWAYPNKEKIIELHRRYGPQYLDGWVERVWVSSLKAIQGENPYDYVGNNRVEFQNLVEKALQKELLAEDESPLVFVSQLAIVDFDFSTEINAFLDQVAQKEFQKQQAEQDVRIAEQEQKATTIRAETNYIQTKRNAEAEKERLIAEAEGQAQARERLADAEAYTIQAKYQAEANGIKKMQDALAASPEAYLTYQKTNQWDGKLPQYWLGSSPIPFMELAK
jgi:hypothetical protein